MTSMGKCAFLFPGQGAQYVGMGKRLADSYPEAKRVFEEANDILGFDLSGMCWDGPIDVLQETSVTQPAVLTMSIAALRVLEAHGAHPQIVAGHSLGEYSALVASGVFTFADAVQVVRQRGELMQAAAPRGLGGMMAVIGLGAEETVKVCRSVTRGVVEPANFNCPGQIVIAGTQPALEKAAQLAKQAGAKRVLPLAVSGPFHSSLVRQAGIGLAKVLEQYPLQDPAIPVVTNITGDYVTRADCIRDALIRQVSQSVHWEESLRRMARDGINTFVEVGPGKVLSGLVKKTLSEVCITNVEDPESLEKGLAELGLGR